MRILVPIHSFAPGGVERVALRLARAWAEEGNDVKVLLGRPEGAMRETAPVLEYIGYPEPFATRRWETIWMIASLLRHLARERPDVLFCPGNTYFVVCVAAKLFALGGCPPVIAKISNDLDPRFLPRPVRPFYALWTRVVGRLLDHFVAIAEPMRLPSARRLKVSADNVLVIPDPALERADLARLARIERRGNDQRHLVAVGRLVPQKNFLLLLKAFARYADQGDRLTIAGEGPQRRRLEEAIAELGLNGRVALCGHLDDVPGLLATADALALSSDYEGVPAVVIEALAAGLPVAATRCCSSIGWLLGEGRFGALARVGSSRSLARAIESALEMKIPVDEARAHIAAFTLERGADAYLDAFRSLPAPARHPRTRMSAGH